MNLMKMAGAKVGAPAVAIDVGLKAMNWIGGYSTYKENRAQGKGVITSAGKAVAQTVLWSDFFLPMLALTAAPAVGQINQGLHEMVGKQQKNLLPMANRFQDSQYAQTSRARAIAAIQESRMNARQFVGNEGQNFATRYRS
jgi:hypothetical protein